jgi:SAM-dependent methyltransferase
MQSSTGALPTPFDDGALYDIFLGELAHDVDFYLGLARAAKGPVLDLCCGTGRILLKILQAGIDAEGADLSPAMLATLRQKAAALGLNAKTTEASMTSFRLERRFGLIVIACNAFPHNLTTEDQLSTLRSCREHLQPGGLLAFDAYFPSAALITAPQNTRVLEIEVKHPETGLPVRNYDTRSFDRVQQRQHSINDLEFLDAAGNVTKVHRSETTVRWIYKFEMELLLQVAGFERWEILGGFDRRALVNEDDSMIVLAWR